MFDRNSKYTACIITMIWTTMTSNFIRFGYLERVQLWFSMYSNESRLIFNLTMLFNFEYLPTYVFKMVFFFVNLGYDVIEWLMERLNVDELGKLSAIFFVHFPSLVPCVKTYKTLKAWKLKYYFFIWSGNDVNESFYYFYIGTFKSLQWKLQSLREPSFSSF